MQSNVRPLFWEGDWATGHLMMLDQKLLPHEEVWLPMSTAAAVGAGIRDRVVRGAPAIGIAAAYGVALGVRAQGSAFAADGPETASLFEMLAATRPTAVNLFWALDRMRNLLRELPADLDARVTRVFEEAAAIMDEDRENNLEMGQQGAALLRDNVRILTHCNTGGLATGGYGTALGIIRTAHHFGKLQHVWVDETRPYLQGARLTAWECLQDGLPATLITDNMAGYFMQQGMVDAVIVGTDRVATNGDVANKIGTYSLAVLCKHHKIPFFVAAPLSTIDLSTATGADIPIEQRSAKEVTFVRDVHIAPDGIEAAHPAFDVTPAHLVTAIVTEKGVAQAPYNESLQALFD
ncbi:MAG: S-methyl-5-thioribose-1-phosphate isomerase [bacterium]